MSLEILTAKDIQCMSNHFLMEVPGNSNMVPACILLSLSNYSMHTVATFLLSMGCNDAGLSPAS